MTDYQAKTPTLLALVSFREFFREGAKPNTFVTLSVYPKKPDHGGDHHITVITRSNRLDLVAQSAEHWTSKPKTRFTVRLPPWSGRFFSLPGVDIHSE